jgi:hypothetical protein
MTMTMTEVLVAALGGEPAEISDALVDEAQAQGVEGLLARSPAAASAAPAVALRLKGMMAGYEVLSAVRDSELARVLGQLSTVGVIPIVIKGSHLAHTIYPSPAMRPREDADFVIGEGEVGVTAAALEQIGYRRRLHVRGALILGQCHFQRTDALGIVHALDVHWRLAAPLVFRRVLPVETLRAAPRPNPARGANGWGPCPPHALTIACVHLIAHHRAYPLLMWRYDLARLVAALDDREVGTFLETARSGGLGAVCASALDMAREYFDGPALAALAATCHVQAGSGREPSARLLSAVRPIDELWLDLQVCEGPRERMALLREHLWPDAAYMRGTTARGWLPAAYARRAVLGVRKWMSPASSDITCAK